MSRRLKIASGIVMALIAISGVGIALSLRQLEPRLREWIKTSLSESLQSQIELGAVHLNFYPLTLTGRDLVVRHRGRTDIPPLIVVSSFTVDLEPMHLWSSTVEHVSVDGM